MKNRKVLISGGSIAGPTLAYWLNKYGYSVTIIERNDTLRLGGQNIDIKGATLEVMEKMGLMPKIQEANTTEVGLKWVNTSNKVVAKFPKKEALSMTQEFEILRGDLVQLLYDATKEQVAYKFGLHITALKEEENGVQITFSNKTSENFDLVISAEGIGSKTRQLVFKNVNFKYTGIYTSYFTIKNSGDKSKWARWCNSTGGIVFLIRPDQYGNTRACINFLSEQKGYEKLSVDEQKKVLIYKIDGKGWKSPQLVEAIPKTDDFYLERVSQVKTSIWSKGRFALVGDAAYCPTLLSGKGTDLAILGAFVLAGELSTHAYHEEAFKAYEKRLRPLVKDAQRLPPGVPRIVYPTTKLGVNILNTIVGIAGSKTAKTILKFFKQKNKKKDQDQFDLPNYQKN